jgi:hypothetical protein
MGKMIDFSKTSSSSKLDSTKRAQIYPTSKGKDTDTGTHSHSHSHSDTRAHVHAHARAHSHGLCVCFSFCCFMKYDRNIDSSCAAMRCNSHLPSSQALFTKMASHRCLFEEANVFVSAFAAIVTLNNDSSCATVTQ